jgi:catechol 2,3-dioxygenase
MAGDLPRPVLHHVNLKTTRTDEMIEWYGTVVGMEVRHRAPAGAWMTNDGANHRLALLTGPAMADDPDKLRHTGMHHLAFEYESLDALFANCERLLALGIRPHAVLDHGMTLSFYFVDPDGNSVELQCDTFGDWAASSQFLRSAPEFAANPIGKACDPQALLAAWRDGVSAEEVHRRAYAGEFEPTEPLDLRLPA